MEWVETTGTTLDEAKERALDELGVDEQDAEFEILEEPKMGLFGRIRVEGRVRARVRPTAPRAKEDRRDRRRRSRSRDQQGRDGSAAADGAAASSVPVNGSGAPTVLEEAGADLPAAAPDEEETATGGGPRRNPSRRRGTAAAPRPGAAAGVAAGEGAGVPPAGAGAGPDEQAEGDDTAGDAEAPAGRSKRRRRRGRSTRPDDAATTSTAGGTAGDRTTDGDPAGDTPTGGRRPVREGSDARGPAGEDEGDLGTMDVALDQQAEAAEQFLDGLLKAFSLDASVTTAINEDDERIEVRIDGDHLGILIGPKGATLLAIQDLARTAVQVKTNARNGRLNVDVAGYREKRAVALSGFVRKVAEQVRTTGKAVALEPMNAADRKVVHDTANTLDGVITRSEGEEDRRHVVLLPADATD